MKNLDYTVFYYDSEYRITKIMDMFTGQTFSEIELKDGKIIKIGDIGLVSIG